MALATKCPHCNTIFRVAADQLKLRGGIVRCGSCALVFDGNAALVEPAPKPTPVIPEVVAEAPPAKPAISDYVHGSPVDFEIDFGEAPAAAAPQAPAAPSPAVWRAANAPASGAVSTPDIAAPAAEQVPAAAQPQAKTPTPDDIAIAAVSRAFAAATTHAVPSPAAPRSEDSAHGAAPSQAAGTSRAAAHAPAPAPSQASVPSRPAVATAGFEQPSAASPQAAMPQPVAAPAPAPAAAQAAARAPSAPAARSLIDVISPDAAFTAAAEPSPPLVPEPPAGPATAQPKRPAGPSSLADLVAPDAIFAATAEPSPPLAAPPVAESPASKAPAPAASAVMPEVLAPDVTFPAATESAPADAAPSEPPPRSAFTPAPAPAPAPIPAPAAAPSPAAEAQTVLSDMPPHRSEPPAQSVQAIEESALPQEEAEASALPAPEEDEAARTEATPPQLSEVPAAPEQAAEESQLAAADAAALEAPPADQLDVPAEVEAPVQPDAAPAEALAPAAENALPWDELPAPIEAVPAAEDEAMPAGDALVAEVPVPPGQTDSSAIGDSAAAEAGEQAGASLVEAIDQWSADNTHPDGRVEPSLDTPQEHLVLAALDDAHHFEDLPSDEPPEPVSPAAANAVEADGLSEPSLDAEPWPGNDTPTADQLAPGGEPWSLSEPDETALHAVAAVNTDAPDDGASVTDDEQAVEQPARSRRERAMKRAKSRRGASVPAAEHDVFAPEGNGPEQEASAEEIAARMRAIAGVDEDAAQAGDDDLDHSDLSFVKRVDRSQKYGKAVAITMAFAIPILLAGLVLQAATTFRDTLAANYPQLKPALAAVCQPLGCKIALPTQLDALSVEPGELASMTENTFSFSTVLRNQSKTPHAWPHVELTLNDNADKPVLRRVFAPNEYLPSPAEAEKGFGPRSEQSIKLYFELKELKASGYHIAIFYP
ncbi:DUF3426 domain-containing protein [Pseudoduganella sp. HUAS MS19]